MQAERDVALLIEQVAEQAADKIRSLRTNLAKGVGFLKDAGSNVFDSLQSRYS
jgi:hypothetical protein